MRSFDNLQIILKPEIKTFWKIINNKSKLTINENLLNECNLVSKNTKFYGSFRYFWNSHEQSSPVCKFHVCISMLAPCAFDKRFIKAITYLLTHVFFTIISTAEPRNGASNKYRLINRQLARYN